MIKLRRSHIIRVQTFHHRCPDDYETIKFCILLYSRSDIMIQSCCRSNWADFKLQLAMTICGDRCGSRLTPFKTDSNDLLHTCLIALTCIGTIKLIAVVEIVFLAGTCCSHRYSRARTQAAPKPDPDTQSTGRTAVIPRTPLRPVWPARSGPAFTNLGWGVKALRTWTICTPSGTNSDSATAGNRTACPRAPFQSFWRPWNLLCII